MLTIAKVGTTRQITQYDLTLISCLKNPSDAAQRRLKTFDIFWQTFAENDPPYEGLGIPVDDETPVFTADELANRCDSAIARALDVLDGDPQGTTPPCP